MPIEARWVLTASPNSAFIARALNAQSARLSITPGGCGWPGYSMGGWCGDGTMSGQKAVQTKGMPSFSATDCAAATDGNRPVATITSQPSAAAAIASNWAGTILA